MINSSTQKLLEELEKAKVDTKKLDKLLAKGDIKINAYIDDKKKITLLHKIIKGNNYPATKWLLENQANPYTEDYYNLPAFFYFIHSSASTKLYHLLEKNNIDFNYKNSQGRMVIQDIVINGDIKIFNRLVKIIKKPFSLDDYGKNILFDAISSGDKETMNLVFEHEEAELDIQDKNKDSLLHFVKDGDLNLIEFLLEKGVPATLQDINNKNIIFYLSERMEKSSSELDIKHITKLIDIALKSKDVIGQKDKDGNNLLTSFLNTLNKPLGKYNQKDLLSNMISKFIDSGINIDEKNNDGNNPLLLAVDKNDIDTVILLIKKCADINAKNADDVTPLALAIMKGNNEYFEMVKLLLSSNADVNIKDKKGISIVEKIIYILIYINKQNMKEVETSPLPEQKAIESDLERFNEDDYMRNIFELLVTRKMVEFDILNSLGNPYFYILVYTENNYLAELLFKSGADINQPNKKRQNILQHYLDYIDEYDIDENVSLKIMKNIVKFGVNLDHRDKLGATIVHNTLLTKPLSITRNIVSAGADIAVADDKGRTLLHNAIWANDIKKVRYIVGAMRELINIPDKLGVIPINYAAFLGNAELVFYLIQHNSYVNNLHEKHKSTIDFFKRFHKNIFKLQKEEVDDKEDKKHLLTLIANMKEEFNIVE